MQVSELEESLKGIIEPCYILSGKIDYLQHKATQLFMQVIDGLVRDFNFSKYSGFDAVDTTINSLNTPPIMSEFRLTVWEIGSANLPPTQITSVVESFKEYLKSPSPTSILLILDDNEKLKTLYKNACVVNCSKFDKYELAKEANIVIQSHELSCDSAVIKDLLERCNDDLSILDNEIIKLKNYIHTNIITLVDVENCIPRTTSYKVYELSDAIAKKNNTKAFKVVEELIMRGEEPMTLLARLVTYYRQAFYVKITKASDEEYMAKFGIKQYPLKLLKESIISYKPMELKGILESLEKLEYRIKIGTIDAKEAIYYAICKLTNK